MAAIKISCPKCKAMFKVDEVHVGKTARCKRCGERFTISRLECNKDGVTSAENPKLKKTIELVEQYIRMEHPFDQRLIVRLGLPATKPEYTLSPSGDIIRGGHIHVDQAIVSVAACLKGGTVKAWDVADYNRKAMEAITHYASLEEVQAFFLLPYYARRGVVIVGQQMEPDEQCRVLAGVENLLLEIYEELPERGVITDELIKGKVDSLLKSVENA